MRVKGENMTASSSVRIHSSLTNTSTNPAPRILKPFPYKVSQLNVAPEGHVDPNIAPDASLEYDVDFLIFGTPTQK